ncbi:MAG TPA: hypothetical protein VGR15_01155 [Bacteroidota bacterium]|nr:hypothetical protein [Bacteroidota bacterium]
MKLIYFFIITVNALYGCRTSESSQKPAAETPDTARTASAAVEPKRPAVVQNVTRVEAVIEKVTALDDVHFTLSLFIVKSDPVTGRYSLIEPQQRVTVHPEFQVSGDSGSVDTNNAQNKKLLSLRDAQTGHLFTGKICIDQRGVWKLLEVERQ